MGRKQTRRAKDAAFTEMADNAPALIWLTDTHNPGIWHNKRRLEYIGRTLGQDLALGWTEGTHPDNRDRCVSGCTEAFHARAFNARRAFELGFCLSQTGGSGGNRSGRTS
jgi:PAS domain-containing protein